MLWLSLKLLVNGVPPQIRNDVKMDKNRLRQSSGHFNEAMQVVDNEPPASHGSARGGLEPDFRVLVSTLFHPIAQGNCH